ncbi:MAG: hypothetical protein EKK53_23395 [Burkholderiales bacterium]|nr:MAG: hypothetical protein EKK53_23395 [Burkholderiales bacterium]
MDLRTLFDRLTDEELLRRVYAGGLTDKAEELALAELESRGLSARHQLKAGGPASASEPVELIVVEKGLPPGEAQDLANCLHTGGIPCAFGDIRREQVDYRRASVVSVNLLVHPAHLSSATEAIAAFRRGEFAIDDDFDPSADP